MATVNNQRILRPYRPSDKMRDLIEDNSLLLMVMNRFGISLGFGDKSVKEICDMQHVDVSTFLVVANFVSKKIYEDGRAPLLSLASLIDYLKRAHSYFLDYNLPTIRRRLIESIDCSGADDVALLILRFYDEYVTEVRRHMEYENETVFAYVSELLNGRLDKDYSIQVFANKHNHIETKLEELKNIIIRYYPQQGNNRLTSVLFDIINCEEDLMLHCMVEDQLFVPVVSQTEAEMRTKACSSSRQPEVADESSSVAGSLDILSEREKEIIRCVAMGMTNKEIAEELFLSINTITTHRRNITNKLQIHTPNGLTIYALVNKLVKLQEIKMG